MLLTVALQLGLDPASASAGVAAAVEFAKPLLLWALRQPLLWTLLIPFLVERVKAPLVAWLRKLAPGLAKQHRAIIRGTAIVLGAVAGIFMSLAQGDLSALDLQIAQIQDGILAILAAFGLYAVRPGTWGSEEGETDPATSHP